MSMSSIIIHAKREFDNTTDKYQFSIPFDH